MSTPLKNTSSGIRLGTLPTHKIGLFGATPVAQRAGAAQAVATDPNSTMALANELRVALVALGAIKGGA